MGSIRLDKFFSSQNILTRTEFKNIFKSGKILINNKVPVSTSQKIDTDIDNITYNGENIAYKKYMYIMLNKPQGVVSATDDKINKTVLDLVPKELYRDGLFPAGRLDKDTVGFVLLTNDGDFAHRILSPKNHVEKTYLVRLDNYLPEGIVEGFKNGVVLYDGTECLKANLKILENTDTPLVEVKIKEGKYHQIKRMFGVYDLGVNWLKRTQIGGLELDPNLQEGECKEMLHKDVEKILSILTNDV